MKIELTISTHNLGYFNTDADNQRYADAVAVKLQAEYPDADISVELVTNVTADYCRVSDDAAGDVEKNVKLIANQVWDDANY